jgi:signal transduction histidine kinase/type II secretory pathway pseudopilin PulG
MLLNILRSNLGKRILLLVTISMVFMLAAFAISGWLAVNQASNRVQMERQALAQAAGAYLDHVLEQNLKLLENFNFAPGVDLSDNNIEPEQVALHNIYLNSLFDQEVFLTDPSGKVIVAEPALTRFPANLAGSAVFANSLATGRTTVSGLVTDPFSGNKAILVVTPIRDQLGKIAGMVGGVLDPAGKSFYDVTHLFSLAEQNYIDILDADRNVLASSDQSRVNPADGAGQNEVSAVSAVYYAPWSVAVRQSAASAAAPVRSMETRLIIFGLLSVVVVFFFAWGVARSIIKPLNRLKEAAQYITSGDLSQPLPETSNDEIGQLSRSFDAMRTGLKESLGEITHLNRDLESIVKKRTRQLEASYHEIERKEAARSELLRKLFTAQEEERKRIARELHDETSQSLNGLVMRLEAAAVFRSDSPEKTKTLLDEMKKLAVRTVDNVHKVIFDLRPAVLDDLGLLSAMRWYAQNRLGNLNVKVRIEVTGEERKLESPVENGVFRVVQEAINNIARHAEAQNVLISVEYEDKALKIEVEDDGKGFVEKNYDPLKESTQGLGLLGMRERVSILGGEIKIDSQPGRGTRIFVRVPTG